MSWVDPYRVLIGESSGGHNAGKLLVRPEELHDLVVDLNSDVEPSAPLLARGRKSVVWVNQQHRPSLMPDKLYNRSAEYFGVGDYPAHG